MILSIWLTTASARTYDEADLNALLRSLAPEVEEVAGRRFVELPPVRVADRAQLVAANTTALRALEGEIGVPPESLADSLPESPIAAYVPATAAVWTLPEAMQRAFGGHSDARNARTLSDAMVRALAHALVDQQVDRLVTTASAEAAAVEDGYVEWVAETVKARWGGAGVDNPVLEAIASPPDSDFTYRSGYGHAYVASWIDAYGRDAVWSLLGRAPPSRQEILAVADALRGAPEYDDSALLGALDLLSEGTAVAPFEFDVARFTGLTEAPAGGRRACIEGGDEPACVAVAALESEEAAESWFEHRQRADGEGSFQIPSDVPVAVVSFPHSDADLLRAPFGSSSPGVILESYSTIRKAIPVLALRTLEPRGWIDVQPAWGASRAGADAAGKLTFRTRHGRYREAFGRRGPIVAMVSTIGPARRHTYDALARLLSGAVARSPTPADIRAATKRALGAPPDPGRPPLARGTPSWRYRTALQAYAAGNAAECFHRATGTIPETDLPLRPRLVALGTACAAQLDGLAGELERLTADGSSDWEPALGALADHARRVGKPALADALVAPPQDARANGAGAMPAPE